MSEVGPRTFMGPVKFMDRVFGPYKGVAVRVYRTIDQTITNDQWSPITFNAMRFDTGGMWNSLQGYMLTCKEKGIYQITGNIIWEANTSGIRSIEIDLNGVTSIAAMRGPNLGVDWTGHAQFISTLYKLDVGDYIRFRVYQNSGGFLDIVSYGNSTPEFMMVKVA